jgi:hypothetical protein
MDETRAGLTLDERHNRNHRGLRLRKLQSFGASRSFQPRVNRSLAQPSLAQPSAKTLGASSLPGSFFMEIIAPVLEPFDAQPQGPTEAGRVGAPESWQPGIMHPTAKQRCP